MKFSLPLMLAIGLVTGLLSGLMGVGGGIIAVPAMVGLLHLTQHRAHGTSLAMMVLTATSSALAYMSRGDIDLRLALMLSIGTVAGGYVGARIMPLVPAHRLRLGFAALLLAVGLKMALSLGNTADPTQALLSMGAAEGPVQIGVEIAIGLVAGTLAGLMGVGGGVIMVPAMVLLLGVGQHTAQGVSLAVIVPTAIVSAYTHYRHGNVVPRLALILGLAAILGALAGSYLAGLISNEGLQRGFGLFVIITGTRMLVVELRAGRRRATEGKKPAGGADPATNVTRSG